jgi:hypothetical protein
MTTINASFRNVILAIIKAAGKEDEFNKAFAENDAVYIKVKNGSWIPLSIEAIGNHHESKLPQISVTHYGESNGDAMRDPEMVFEIHPNGHWIANNFRNDWIGVDREMVVKRDDKGMPIAWRKDSFPAIWARNLRDQGFIEAAKQCH